jgi:hypothetical protein
MGYIVYRSKSKQCEKYYKKESVAKAAVTRGNKDLLKYQYARDDDPFAYCSYAEYEGFLQGMNNSQWVMWKFMHQPGVYSTD